MQKLVSALFGCAFALLLGVALIGCGNKPAGNSGANSNTATGQESSDADNDAGEWWCVEHAVPEEVCGVCNKAYGETCKKKGDWCEEHSMPDSHCFACHPELQEKFAVMYRNRFGKEPPPIQKETDGHHDDH